MTAREVVQIVEMLQPLCSRTFGVSPCTATGTNDTKCYNTRATCQDTANFALGTPLSLFFSRGNVAEQVVDGAPYIIPSLISVSTSPTRVNLARIDGDAGGLGNRAVLTVIIADQPHTDRMVDPYIDGRSWDAMTRGSFWSKWLVRNKYRTGMKIRLYEGYAGQSLASMSVREYYVEKINHAVASGRVTIQAKDILAKAEERKAQAPTPSPGVLKWDIGATVTEIYVSGALSSDYGSSGTLRIDDECMTYSAVTVDGSDLIFTISQRGSDNTTANNHSVDTIVQDCIRYTNEKPYDVLEDLLGTYAGIGGSMLDTSGWQAECDQYINGYAVSALLSEPDAVSKYVAELCEQCGFVMWGDERESRVKLRVIRGIDSDPDVITDAANIVAGSFAVEELPKGRASQVWVTYGPRSGAFDPEQISDYTDTAVVAYLDTEEPELYGEPSIRHIFSRWLPTRALATTTASRIAARYKDVPRRATFTLDAKDRAYSIGDVVEIDHFAELDQYGERLPKRWTIISWEETMPGERVRLVCEDTTIYGKIYTIQGAGASDYTVADRGSYKAWITDANGNYSNGDPGARIS